MATKNLILAVVLVLLLGAGAHWYINSLDTGTNPSTSAPTSSETTKPADNEASETDASVRTNSESSVPTSNQTQNTAPTADNSSSGESVEDTLSDLDTLFEDEYDDSSLSSEFNDDDFNSLTGSYEN